MALSLDYVVRETAGNLRRNFLMTSAAILTVAVSLFLVGVALLLKQGVANATIQWRGGVELSIYMQQEATASQTAAIERELNDMPEVKRVTYVDQQEAFAEFKTMFANDPAVVESLTAEDLPPSYRVVPKRAELAEAIGARFHKQAGVLDVVFAKETVDALLKFTSALQIGIVSVALVLLLSAALLILNTVRMAIFARRREIAVMKLVGATNWFIRVPFMLEGLVQGLVGAGIAFLLVSLGRGVVSRAVQSSNLQLINQLVVSGKEVVGTGIFLLVMGAIVSVSGSAIALRRFLDV